MSIDTMNEAVSEAVDTVADLGTNVAKADMYRDVVSGKVQQVRGRMREAKGALTDSNQDRFYGRRDQLVGMLQEKYGYTRIQAVDFLNEFVSEAILAETETEEETISAERSTRKAGWIGLALVAVGSALVWRFLKKGG